MYHVTRTHEVETCRKKGHDQLVHFTYRKDAEKYAAREAAKEQARLSAAREQREVAASAGKAKLDQIAAPDAPDLDPYGAQAANWLLAGWEMSRRERGVWNAVDEAERISLLNRLTFKHERWLAIKYDLGSVNYGPRRVIYEQAHPDWIADANRGEGKYRKLAKVLREVESRRDERPTPWIR